MNSELRRSIAILAVVVIVTAWFSETFYFPDEHYQILEFMGSKLGITPRAELPWNFPPASGPGSSRWFISDRRRCCCWA
jgi:phosphatidylinositol glycan class B